MIEIAKAKALLEENGIFVTPESKKKQKESYKSDLKSFSSNLGSKKSESGRSVKKEEILVEEDKW